MYPSYADVREIGLASSSHALMRSTRATRSTAADAPSTCVVVSVFVPGTAGSPAGAKRGERDAGKRRARWVRCRALRDGF